MILKPNITIADHFFNLEYVRIERTKHYQLIDTGLSDFMRYN
jgi:hypothetical protein